MSKGFPSYVALLQYGTDEEAYFSANLVGLCGTQQTELREPARFHLQHNAFSIEGPPRQDAMPRTGLRSYSRPMATLSRGAAICMKVTLP